MNIEIGTGLVSKDRHKTTKHSKAQYPSQIEKREKDEQKCQIAHHLKIEDLKMSIAVKVNIFNEKP